ncbi:MAG: MFS transporter [Bradyrhizobium sp.]|jgi:MHS family shikimate/dehydroshikimate transporter-like MFS transporter
MATLEIASSAEQATPAKLRQIVLASVLGTAVEWYDFLIYGVGAALVFNKLFFPTFDPLVGTLAAFGSYAVGFVARPLGGAIFGHFGDRLGRKAMLTMTMVIMGGGTFLIGLLPTYSQIGILAPTLLILLRLLQGIGIGGEWGGAVLMVIESGDAKRRGFLGSLVQVGFPLGMVLATIVFAAVSKLPEADFLAWGWRIPFLVSVLLVGVGLFVRLKLVETPKFQQVRARNDIARLPIVEVLLKDWRNFLIAVGLKVTEVAWVYILTVFIVFYASSRLALPRAVMLDAVLYAALLEMLTIPLFGLLSDRIGRKALYIAGAIFSALFAFPLFSLLETRDTTIITLTIALAMSLSHGMMFGPQAAFLPELFGTKVRYSGASLGCQVSAAISGGFAPLIATALLAWENGTHSISLYMVCLSAITLVAVFAARETAFREL